MFERSAGDRLIQIPTCTLIGLSLIVLTAHARGEEMLEVRAVKAAVLEGAEKERFVAAHNAARKEVGVEEVTWSEKLAAYALEGLLKQQEDLVREAKEGWEEVKAVLPQHREDLKYGENIAGWMGSGRAGPVASGAERAVAMWMREKGAFDRLNAVKPYRVGDEEVVDAKATDAKDQPEEKKEEKQRPVVVGHYTQIVWRQTKQIGAAKLTIELVDEKGNGRFYVAIICSYEPPGNRRGEQAF